MKILTNISLCPYPNPKDTAYNPIIPYWGSISGGVQVGKLIEIKGSVPYGADIFQVNLTCGQDNGPQYADRVLHISVRFNENGHKAVVRNSMNKNEWEDEERGGVGFPFKVGQGFMMMILVEDEFFRIGVDGKHQWDFRHRLPFSRASMLYINGTVKVDEIRYLRMPAYMPSGISTPAPYPSPIVEPVFNPRIPYSFPIREGLQRGTMMYISGRPTTRAERFTFNLQCDSSPYPGSEDIAFHFDVRMFNSSLVRNTRVKNSWGKEETRCPYFPFQTGVFFDLIIRVENDKYMVALNGQHFLEFYHRIFPLSKVNVLNIEGDIIVSSIRVAL